MPTKLLIEYAMIAEILCAWTFFAVLLRKRLARDFSFLAAYAAAWGTDLSVRVALLYFHREMGLTPQATFNYYFYDYWTFALVEHVLVLFTIYQLFRRAMMPFNGLRRLGTMVFNWVCGVAVVVTLGILLPGHVTLERYVNMTSQFDQAISILTVCLLLFVGFAIRHLGMTYRSHLFGASLGLGIIGTKGLVLAGTAPLYSPRYLGEAVCGVIVMSIWAGYFLIPEPEHKLVLLPTTSPYFHWNQISEALGNDPGVVAVSGFTPDALSPAERLVLGAASSGRKPSISVRMHEHATATGTQR